MKLAFILIFCLAYISVCAQPINIYVSNSTGADNFSGSISRPLKTIEGARLKARSYKNPMKGDINIIVRSGIYYLDGPLTFDKNDGGTNGFKVKYRAYNNEKVIVSGGRVINPGWVQHQKYKENHIWQIDLSKKNMQDQGNPKSRIAFRQLWVDGKKAKRARCGISVTGAAWSMKGSEKYKINFKNDVNGKTLLRTTNKKDLEVLTYWQWMANIIKVDTITDNYQITTNIETPYMMGFAPTTDKPQLNFGVENAFEFIDEPGEWYYNKHTNYLYYYPEKGANPNNSEIIFPVVQQIVKASGVSNIEFDGFTFSHATWTYPNDHGYITGQGSIFVEYVPGQGNIHHVVSPANIEFTNCTNVTVRNCRFYHLGAEAICFQNGSSNNLVDNNQFEDVAGTGIRIGNGLDFNHNNKSDLRTVTYNNTVSNNTISNVANEYKSHCGIWLGFVNNNKVINNRLTNLPYTGISTGYPAPRGAGTLLGSNTIDNNYISNVLNTLRDGGAIYNHAPNTGQSYIRNNKICNITPIAVGNDRAGIYLDQGSSNFVVSGYRGNLTYKVNNTVKQYLTFTNFADGNEINNLFKNNDSTKCE